MPPLTHKSHTIHLKDLTDRLQKEIDGMLHKIDDTTLYAEFRDDEMVEIQDGVHHDMTREMLDQRIASNITRRAHKTPFIQSTVQSTVTHSVRHTTKLHKKIQTTLNFLFRPFEL